MPVLEKPTDDEIEKFKKRIERRKTFHEETSKTIKWTLHTLVATCLFCVVTLFGTSDVHLLTPNSTVKLPILNYDMSFVAFLVVGPVVLIGLTTYLHIFVGQQRIATIPVEDQFAMLSNFDNKTSKLVIIFLLYWMVPLTLSEFAWKAKPRSDGFEIYLVACVVAVGLGYLQFRRCPKEHRAWGVAILLCTVVLYISYTTVRIWNRHLSLFKADLSEQDLRGTNLELAFLSEANIEKSNLSVANLRGANLVGANLTGADLVSANLTGALLRRANLSGADLERANLTGAEFLDTNLTGAKLDYAKLRGAILFVADLSRAKLEYANLSEAFISAANLSGADLERANLTGADLERANLTGADLERANLTGAKLLDANLSGADLEGANLTGADLERANLTGAEFLDTNLTGAKLLDANLSGTDLRWANLSGADLLDANLSGADFSGATLMTTTPYRDPLSCESLMGQSYCAFPWPINAQSGAIYQTDYPPNIDPSLLIFFTVVGNECTWLIGLEYVECAGRLHEPHSSSYTMSSID